MSDQIAAFVEYLLEQVRIHDIYVLSGQGEYIVDILPYLTDKESTSKVKQILTLISKNLKAYDGTTEFSMMTSRAFDCSGLGTYYFILRGLIKGDTTADGLYVNYCTPIKKSELIPGDMVFQQGTKTVEVTDAETGKKIKKQVKYMHHVGYYIGEGKVVESKGRQWGVVQTELASGGWSHCGRPKFWDDQPQPIGTLTRELYLTSPMMSGDDVKMVQDRLNELAFNCGKADGVFGSKTKTAVQQFQRSKNLNDDGIVGKKTCEALGFVWNG